MIMINHGRIMRYLCWDKTYSNWISRRRREDGMQQEQCVSGEVWCFRWKEEDLKILPWKYIHPKRNHFIPIRYVYSRTYWSTFSILQENPLADGSDIVFNVSSPVISCVQIHHGIVSARQYQRIIKLALKVKSLRSYREGLILSQ